MSDELLWAISRRAVVRLAYGKDNHADPRVCHPHVVYQSSTGKILVDAYQIAGPSTRGGLAAWRPFEVRLIDRVDVLDEVSASGQTTTPPTDSGTSASSPACEMHLNRIEITNFRCLRAVTIGC